MPIFVYILIIILGLIIIILIGLFCYLYKSNQKISNTNSTVMSTEINKSIDNIIQYDKWTDLGYWQNFMK